MFRTNFQKKCVDVWLVYRCRRFDRTWNYPIHERCALKDFSPRDLRAFAENCATTAHRHAFDVARLRRFADRIDVSADVIVRKSVRAEALSEPQALEILLNVPFDSVIRVDRFLATELGMSRTAIRRLHDTGSLVVVPIRRAALRQAIRDQQTVSIDLRSLCDAPDLVATILRRAASP